MWPGFDVRLNVKEAGVFLNIEPCHKVVRFETAFEVMRVIIDNCESRNLDFQKQLCSEFERKTVVTLYNDKSYMISHIAFDMSPKSTFLSNDGSKVSFIDYYKMKYNLEIKDPNQFLLASLNKRTGQETFLIPEFCRMTGLSDALLDDFRAMREIKSLTHSDAPLKVKECLKLFNTLKESKECSDLMKEMDIDFVQ